ncbi:MAG: hypothetical protein CME16_00790 [Gemmatimonadetes bacterium]|nr:hypothetical protein [Gemmatimonadota bacterium]
MKRFLAIGLLVLSATSAWTQAYRLEADRLVVEPHHWPEWQFPQGTLEFSEEGVQAIKIRPQINAALDAGNFTYGDDLKGGIRDAGTNLNGGIDIIDGSLQTFWEPAPGVGLDKWWVEIDLGRIVWAQKIVVKFADGVILEGDPFLQFKVMTSNGDPAFLQSKSLNYLPAGRSEGLNKTQRTFEFELQPTRTVDEGLKGDLIQYIQIVATASDGGRAQEIPQASWNSLGEHERGDVVYFRRDALGGLREVDRVAHEAIQDENKKGPVKFYRRERPRLAEVEVWAQGDNISIGALERGGRIVGYGNLGDEPRMVDGGYNTLKSIEVGFSGNDPDVVFQDPNREIFFDLGAWYWVNHVAILFGDRYSNAFPNYVLNLSDGGRAPDGSLAYVPLISRGLDAGPVHSSNRFILFQDNVFPLTRARYFKMDYILIKGSSRPAIREIQLYGRGYMPIVELESPLIELGRNPRILSKISFEGETPPGTELGIRTRTGNVIENEIHYFTNTGAEVTEKKYRKLLSFQKGDSTVSVIPGAGWSSWSQFYPASGAAITSPSPRRYIMVQTSLRSGDPEMAPRLHNLSLELEMPLARQILGEIAPRRTKEIGKNEVFTLFLQPDFQSGNRSFDQILVKLPPGTQMELIDLKIGTEAELLDGSGMELENLTQVESGFDSLWVQLPALFEQQPGDLLALRFSGKLYLASNAFRALVGLDEGEEQVWQQVDAGEASTLVEGQGMTVLTPLSGDFVGTMEVSPNPFTPNGDGINDVVEMRFPVFKIQGSKALVLEVYCLGGTLVRRLEEKVVHVAGKQQITWDGLGPDGALVPPGLYLCRIGIEVDASGPKPMVSKLVSIVY